MDFINNIKNWPFLQEPLYRWVLFLIALSIIGAVWAIIVGYIKS